MDGASPIKNFTQTHSSLPSSLIERGNVKKKCCAGKYKKNICVRELYKNPFMKSCGDCKYWK